MHLTIQRRDYPHDPISIFTSVQRITSDGETVCCHRLVRRGDGRLVNLNEFLPLTAVAEMHLTEDDGEAIDP